MRRAGSLLARLWPWVLALLVVGPLLRPGYVLAYDMVFVPDLALRRDLFGFGSALPRAVPSDAVVALLDEVVPGMVLQKLVLLAALVLAGEGARRLVPCDDLVAQLAATSLYVWNPFVAERLGIGHWPLLLTYAALPWIYDSARRWRIEGRGLARLTLWLALGSLSAVGGVVATAFALACVSVPSRLGVPTRARPVLRRAGLVIAVAAAVNAPWVVAGLSHGEAALSDPAAVEAFSARGEGGLPPWLTVLGLGGVWNAEVVPASRSGWGPAAALLVTLAVSAAGARRIRGGTSADHLAGALVVAAVVGVAAALLGAVAPESVRWLVERVPGAGLVRDGTRFLALLAPLLAFLFGHGASALVRRLRPSPVRAAPATLLVLLPLVLLPDLAGGLAGRLSPVAYPAELLHVRAVLEERRELSDGGAVLLVPFTSYRRPAWNDDRRTLDPLGRFMTPDYVASDVLVVSGRRIPGEDARARRVDALLSSARSTEEVTDELREQGIRWILLDKEARRQLGAAATPLHLDGEQVVHEGELLVLWELAGPVADGGRRGAWAVGLVASWALAGLSLLAAAASRLREVSGAARAPGS